MPKHKMTTETFAPILAFVIMAALSIANDGPWWLTGFDILMALLFSGVPLEHLAYFCEKKLRRRR